MKVSERIAKFRSLMEEKQIDAYIIPSADYHQSEYVGEHFKARAYITGFTGSAGTVVITKNEVGLWTDGRYFIQATNQLEASGVTLFKMGNAGVPTIEQYLESFFSNGGTLGFYGAVMAAKEGEELENMLSSKNVKIDYSHDLIDKIWDERPILSNEPAFVLTEEYCGESTSKKLERLRLEMKKAGATTHIIATLDDTAWLLNIRGNDVLYSPLVLCYSIVTMDKVLLFADENKFDKEIKAELAKNNVSILPYNDIYKVVEELSNDEVVLIDSDRINYALFKNIPKNTKKVLQDNPTVLFKAMKNEIELKNIRKAHIKDGVACVKFMRWLKSNVGKINITEIDASDKLESFRAEQEGYLWPSFDPISAYGEHAAITHYSATKETDCKLLPEGLYLMDTGGNYYEGSTDISRTFALGEISDELKLHFTTVLKSMMSLSKAKFMYGIRGYNLDILARAPMWDMNINYNHGTGHGVGYLLNVHEGPSGFRWQIVPSKHETHVLEEGMVITNEPGIYIEGSHGVRIENELVVRKGLENAYGQFMYFETVTYAPIDIDAIDASVLTKEEKDYFNNYHKLVYDTLSNYLDDDEREWLKIYTREI